MIEQAITQLLRAHAPLMTLLASRAQAVDLVDVHQDVAAPYLVFNLGDGTRMGRGNLCEPAALGALEQQILITPWAATAPEVHALNEAAWPPCSVALAPWPVWRSSPSAGPRTALGAQP